MNNLFIFSQDLFLVQELFNFIVTHSSNIKLQVFLIFIFYLLFFNQIIDR